MSYVFRVEDAHHFPLLPYIRSLLSPYDSGPYSSSTGKIFRKTDLQKEKKSKRLPLETKNTLQIENGSLSFIETLHKQ